MAAGDSGVDRGDLDARHELGFFDRFRDALDGGVDVDDDAFAQARRGRGADADDVDDGSGPVSTTSPTMQQILVVPMSSPTTKSFLDILRIPLPWRILRDRKSCSHAQY